MEYLKLIGIIIIIGGFALKLDTIFTIVLAGFITALVSGIIPVQFFGLLGKAFVENSLVTLFILTLPIIGICEANGLKKQAVNLINNMKGLTIAKFLIYIFSFLIPLGQYLSTKIRYPSSSDGFS